MGDLDLVRIEGSFFSVLRQWRITESNDCGRTCLEELMLRLPHIDSESWPARFDLGGIYLDKRPARATTVISPPCILEYYEPRFDPAQARSFFPQISGDMVVFRDADLAIAFKPAGLPTTASRDQVKHNLEVYLHEILETKVHLPSRLDTAVSGMLIVSLSSRMNRYLQRAYEKRRIAKYYLAVVSGGIEWEKRDVMHPITRNPRHSVLRMTSQEGGKSAHTQLIRLHSLPNGSALLQAEPLTGRTHQIRVHCMAEGIPIIGDPYYGGHVHEALHLASFAISLRHPYTGAELYFEIPKHLRPQWLNDIESSVGGISIIQRNGIWRHYDADSQSKQ